MKIRRVKGKRLTTRCYGCRCERDKLKPYLDRKAFPKETEETEREREDETKRKSMQLKEIPEKGFGKRKNVC